MPRRYDTMDFNDYDEDGAEGSYSEETGYEDDFADSDSYDSDQSVRQTRLRWSENNDQNVSSFFETGVNLQPLTGKIKQEPTAQKTWGWSESFFETGVVLQPLTGKVKQEPVKTEPTAPKTWGSVAIEKPVSILDLQEEEHKNKIKEEERRKQEEIMKQMRNSGAQPKRLLVKDDKRYDLLCINGPKHRCKMAHDFKQWKPRFCRFHHCKNGSSCIYWHSQSESLKDYLYRCCKNEKSFFYKNRNYFMKYYLDLKS